MILYLLLAYYARIKCSVTLGSKFISVFEILIPMKLIIKEQMLTLGSNDNHPLTPVHHLKGKGEMVKAGNLLPSSCSWQ